MEFVFFSSVDWDWSGGAHTPTQLAVGLARQGHSIAYVQVGKTDQQHPHDQVEVLSLQDIGWNDLQVARALHGLDGGSVERLVDQLSARVVEGTHGGVAVWFAPIDPFVRLHPFLKNAGHRTVYFPPDDFEAMADAGFSQFHPKASRYLAENSDLIVCYAALAERMRIHAAPVNILPHVVELDTFQRPPYSSKVSSPILRGGRTLGFWGYLNAAMFDADAVEFVARERPRWAINLLGAYDAEPQFRSVYEQLRDLPNVRFHGPVAQDELAAYAEDFDVCLIPAPLSEFSRGRDPIKLYQYLAAHKPVVTLNMPHLTGIPCLRNATTHQEFLDDIENAVKSPVDSQLIDEFLRGHSPESVAGKFAKIVDQLPHQGVMSRPIQAAPLETFAKKNPPLESYLDFLEGELLGVRKWALELEAQAKQKDKELERIRKFSAIRLFRTLDRRRRRQPIPKSASGQVT